MLAFCSLLHEAFSEFKWGLFNVLKLQTLLFFSK